MNLSVLESSLNENKISFETDKAMSALTSFRIGGPADIVIYPSSEEETVAAVRLCREHCVPVTVIGKGSNILVSDKGIEGAVICLAAGFESMSVSGDTVISEAGAPLTALCNFCLSNSLSGLEFAFGIPGSVGGAVNMNAGAYGGEMKDVVKSVRFVDLDGAIDEYEIEELSFSYRSSVFKHNRGVILSAKLKLLADSRENISSKMNDFMSRRREKQPLNMPSAGSVFKRPQGNFAGTLIEKSGLKGFSIGGAQVSEKHAGFIVNKGAATCDDVLRLVEHIRKTVNEQFDVMLEPEIIKIGR